MRVLRRSLLLPLFALVLLTIVMVPPVGNFPLNDDWVYATPVKSLLDGHGYVAHPYRAAYGIFQAYWGAAFCLAFGYSYTVLRVSTLILATIAMWLTAKCAREIGTSRNVALFCGAVLLANPLFMNLSYTFMTEVPYIASMAASGYFYLRALRRGHAVDVLLGSAFAVLAFGNRQYGVLASVAFVASLLIANRAALVRPGALHAAAFIAPWLVLALTYAVLRTMPDNPMQRIGIAGNISLVRQIGLAINALYSIPLYIIPYFTSGVQYHLCVVSKNQLPSCQNLHQSFSASSRARAKISRSFANRIRRSFMTTFPLITVDATERPVRPNNTICQVVTLRSANLRRMSLAWASSWASW